MVQASGVILAGGASKRMGRDKAWVQVDGQPLIVRVIDRLREVCSEIIIVANNPAPYSALSARVVPDLFPDRAPLVGIYSGLSAAQLDHAVVVGCDMPFLNPALLRYMLSLASDFDVVIPSAWDEATLIEKARSREPVRGSDMHPLHAFYGKACLAPIESRLSSGNLRVIDFYPDIRLRVVSPSERARYDPDGLSLYNANTPEQLERAEEIVRARKREEGSAGEPGTGERFK